jgi:glycerophosphoryl diester phosphodiesterase
MGGGGDESRGIGDIRSLIEKAKEELRKGNDAGKKKNVFISFDYSDIDEVNLLRGQAKSEKSPLEFNDWSVSEAFDSDRAAYIKQKISDRINQSSLTVVYLSDRTLQSQWVDWEIEESIRLGKTVIGVHKGKTRPAKLPKLIKKHKLKVVSWSKLADTITNIE